MGRRLRLELKRRGDLLLLAPVVRNRKGFHTDVAEWAAKHGYAEVRADGKMHSTREPFRLDRFREHDVEIVIGVLPAARQRTAMALKTDARRSGRPSPRELIDEALKLGHGTLFALDNHRKVSIHSTERSCPKCGLSFEPLDPKQFSYNSPRGWCPRCRGFGELFYMPEGVDRGAREDAIAESWYGWQEGQREPCPECNGSRLNPIARSVRLEISNFRSKNSNKRASALSLDTLAGMSVEAAERLFRRLRFRGPASAIACDILPEIRERLEFLCEVGLGYLQLGRGVPTLSGGESRRIRLAAQLGSNLSGVLYILDEPTIGLHARDNEQLLAMLEKLKSRGNSILVVEHDEETMRRADYIVDLGPGAGAHGGELVAAGTLQELLRHPESVTGRCLRAHKTFPARGERRPCAPVSGEGSSDCALVLHNASKNNLKNLTVRFPLGRLVCVTGVSGSGKSTLVRECLFPALERNLKSQISNLKSANGRITGWASIKSVYEVDQSPIGRTPRSVPATYVGFFDDIRRLFAQVPEARLRGYSPSRFSFNSAQGRCPACEGVGQIKLEMSFLPPAFVRCESCGGSRFDRGTLDIEYRGKNIARVLEFTVEEALEFFSTVPRIQRALRALCDTGLGYLQLGQTSPTLSGGEAQRVKLVSHLLAGLKEVRSEKGEVRAGEVSDVSSFALHTSNLFILEEPTIGLHMADVRLLVDVLQRLVDAGHSVIVIEHNLDLIAEADWIIDLGPEGGQAGGAIVAEGTPEQVAHNKRSHTGQFLRGVLARP